MFWLVTPSSNKNLYNCCPASVFLYAGFPVALYKNWGWIACIDFLINSIAFLGLAAKYNALPLCNTVITLDAMFLAEVSGPKTVFPTWIIPLGNMFKYLHAALEVIPLLTISSPLLIASAHSLVVNLPSRGDAYIDSSKPDLSFKPVRLVIISLFGKALCASS